MARFILATALALAFGQTNAQPYAGTWTGDFNGQTFVRLELRTTDGKLGGTISLGNVEVDKQGDLKSAGAAPKNATPIFEVAVKDSVLAFARRDGRDTDRFQMRVTGAGTAELQPILTDADRKELTAQGIPGLKAFRLKKQ
jgi:hypothetical protein